MSPKPESCRGCPLYAKGQGFVPDAVVSDPAYVFIGEAPGKQEVHQHKPFVGAAGFVLRHWLLRAVPQLQVASEQQKISICNTLRCLPPTTAGRAYPTGAERIASEQHCTQYNEFGSAPTVVLFGESAQRRWFSAELEQEDRTDKALGHDLKGVMGRIGRVYQKDGRRWIFAPHPAWILRQPHLVEHGQQALRIAAGVRRIEPVYTTWWETCP
jgi:DNA polymerase